MSNPFYAKKTTKKNERPAYNLGGSFACQSCKKKSMGAFYDIEDSVLVWWCEDGHMSIIEEYRLG